MAISKARKDELVAQYVDLLNNSRAIILTEYKGMSVKQVEELRGKIREIDGAFHVTKNSLLKVALEETGKAVPEEMLVGQLATGFALGEVPALAKAFVDFAKTEDDLVIRGGIMDASVLDTRGVEALASLPSLDQLRGQLIGLIQAPAQNIVSAVTNGVRQVVNVLDAYVKKDENPAADAA